MVVDAVGGLVSTRAGGSVGLLPSIGGDVDSIGGMVVEATGSVALGKSVGVMVDVVAVGSIVASATLRRFLVGYPLRDAVNAVSAVGKETNPIVSKNRPASNVEL